MNHNGYGASRLAAAPPRGHVAHDMSTPSVHGRGAGAARREAMARRHGRRDMRPEASCAKTWHDPREKLERKEGDEWSDPPHWFYMSYL